MRYSGFQARLRATRAGGLLSVLAFTAALAPGASAIAQEAERVGGPLTLLSAVPSSVMVMTRPEAAADRRMETWQWTFLSEPQAVSTITYDTMAVHSRWIARP